MKKRKGKIMDVTVWKVLSFVLLFTFLNTIEAAPKILVVRKQHWDHPVESVFKKYDISLYKVHYSKDGTCPTFFAKFKYSLDPKAPHSINLQNVYRELLKANSYFPYALVDKDANIKVNVGWKDEQKKVMLVELVKATSVTTCKGNSHAHVDDTADFDKFIINAQMKKKILSSSFKVPLKRKDGRKFVAYLYAEDEQNKSYRDSDCDGKFHKITSKVGLYHIYLYDVSTDSFFSGRIESFRDTDKMEMNVKGADFFALPSVNKNKSDVLLVSQHYFCQENKYEAYGFSDRHLFLKRYTFLSQIKSKRFEGRVFKSKKDGKLFAYNHLENKPKLYLSVSSKLEEIQLKPVHEETVDSKIN